MKDESFVSANTNISDIILLLWRERRFLILTFFLVIALLAPIPLLQENIYAAQALVALRPPARPAGLEAVVPDLPLDKYSLGTEAERLQSPTLIRRVMSQLQLFSDPELTASALGGGITYLANRLMPPRHEGGALPQEKETALRERKAAAQFVKNLRITPIQTTYSIQIQYSSHDPYKASEIVNALVKNYMELVSESRNDVTDNFSHALSGRVEKVRNQLIDAQNAVATYREKYGLLEIENESARPVTPTLARIFELTRQLSTSQSEKATAQAKLNQIQNLLASGKPERAPEVLDAPSIVNFRTREAELEREAANLSTVLGPKHYRLIAVNAERDELQKKIRNEVERIGDALKAEAGVQSQRMAALEKDLAYQKQQALSDNLLYVHLHQLKQDASALKELYERLLYSESETIEQVRLALPQAEIIASSEPPARHESPRRMLMFLAIFGVAGGGAVITALVKERLRKTYLSAEELEDKHGVDVIGLIPRVRRGKALTEPIFEAAIDDMGLALHSRGWSQDRKARIVLVSSAFPREGKSSIALSMARQLSRVRENVVLIDLDWRRPAQHQLARVSRDPGIVDLARGTANLEEIIKKDPETTLHIVPAGQVSRSSANLLQSDSIAPIMRVLAESYNEIIIDSSPIMLANDALILARYAAEIVFVVRWAKSRQSAVAGSLHRLRKVSEAFPHVVLNFVDAERYSWSGHADSGRYSRRYYSYYLGANAGRSGIVLNKDAETARTRKRTLRWLSRLVGPPESAEIAASLGCSRRGDTASAAFALGVIVVSALAASATLVSDPRKIVVDAAAGPDEGTTVAEPALSKPSSSEGKTAPAETDSAVGAVEKSAPTDWSMGLDALLARGDQCFRLDDLQSARAFYQLAARQGSGMAAARIAHTYDPSFIGGRLVPMVRPDYATAIHWYDKASALGYQQAASERDELLKRLERNAADGTSDLNRPAQLAHGERWGPAAGE